MQQAFAFRTPRLLATDLYGQVQFIFKLIKVVFRPLPYCLRLGLGLGIDSNGPRVQRGLGIGEHGVGLGVGGTPYDGVSFPGFRYMKGWAFHYIKNRKGRVRLLQHL